MQFAFTYWCINDIYIAYREQAYFTIKYFTVLQLKKTITKSYFVVTLWACRRSRLQSLYLLKDKVDLSLSSFIAVVAPADIQ